MILLLLNKNYYLYEIKKALWCCSNNNVHKLQWAKRNSILLWIKFRLITRLFFFSYYFVREYDVGKTWGLTRDRCDFLDDVHCSHNYFDRASTYSYLSLCTKQYQQKICIRYLRNIISTLALYVYVLSLEPAGKNT